ncbi:hypothetical protein TEQG_03694 [Trichophyton equinum CBS 127.97]|uniref:Uncharacterized protein n=1 Tax=Trichophyton equinum (strain ATCC MYA-4606 / CBS 127.97) TaxID=559882 RepID=F2PRH8_TRIEC|nr:hypothetical protein TEQG_03694 [Trichophyton equinum CBS 127.97]
MGIRSVSFQHSGATRHRTLRPSFACLVMTFSCESVVPVVSVVCRCMKVFYKETHASLPSSVKAYPRQAHGAKPPLCLHAVTQHMSVWLCPRRIIARSFRDCNFAAEKRHWSTKARGGDITARRPL